MQQVLLGIRNDKKAKFLLDFLSQLDFIEILKIMKDKDQKTIPNTKDTEDIFLTAPVLTDDEIENIEHIGKEFDNWQINEF